MYSSKKKRLAYWGLFCDLLSLNIAFLIAYGIRFHSLVRLAASPEYRSLLFIANVIYLLIELAGFKGGPQKRRGMLDTGLGEVRFVVGWFAVSYLAFIVFIQGYEYSRTFHLIILAVFAAVFTIQRMVIFPRIEEFILKSGKKVKVVLVGAGNAGMTYLGKLREMSDYYDLVAVLDDNPKKGARFNGEFRGPISALENVLRTNKVDEVVVSIPPREKRKIRTVTETADRYYTMVKTIPSFPSDMWWRKVQIEDFDGMWLFTMFQSRLLLLKYQLSKRVFDIVFSSIVVFTILPALTLVVMPIIRLGSKGSTFFMQWRKGYRGEEFECLKFRTMKVLDKSAEACQARAHDPRKTRFGDFLRKSSLDELPQFWNVLKGEMSVVGPRPHMVEHDTMYNEIISNYHVRLFAKPGITGWAQINGYRGATPDPELMRKRVEHDIWYLENWSFWLDMKIIFLTALRIFKGDPNAY